MGLDSVELLLAIEEEFGVEVPDRHAEQLHTVADVYDWLKRCVAGIDPDACLSQSVFYKLRRALIENYGWQRSDIAPNSRLTELADSSFVEEGWPYLQMFIDVNPPPFKVANKALGYKLSDNTLTVRQLVDALIRINGQLLTANRNSDDEIWHRLVQVFCRQLNLLETDIYPGARIVRDLGVD